MTKKSGESNSSEEELSVEVKAVSTMILSLLGAISTIVTALALKWGIPFK